MAIYTIPEKVIPGFEQIIELDKTQLDFFKGILENFSTGSLSNDALESMALKANISLQKVDGIMEALVSMTEIYLRSKNTPEKFSEDFTQSFIIENKNARNLDLIKFKENITALVSAMGQQMRLTIKAREIITSNQNNYAQAKIISDIRIVYDDESSLDKKDQLAVLVHNLRIRYNSIEKKQLIISLDLSDLYSLKEVIERAIEKDKLIRGNTHNLTFVDPK